MADGTLFEADTLQGDCHPRVFAYYFKEWRSYTMDYHSHPATEIMYVIHGQCRVEVRQEGRESVSLPLRKGELILLGAHTSHRLIVEDTCRMLNVEFRFVPGLRWLPAVQEWAGKLPELAALLTEKEPFLLLHDPDEIYRIMKSLVLELDRGDKESPQVQLLLLQLFLHLARLKAQTRGPAAEPTGLYSEQALTYLQQNYDREIRVEDVAAAVNLHPGYLQRIFKQRTGQTLIRQLTVIRMEKAEMLLTQTDIPVGDICGYVGIGSRPYFHALFKEHWGLTPAECRRAVNRHVYVEEGSREEVRITDNPLPKE